MVRCWRKLEIDDFEGPIRRPMSVEVASAKLTPGKFANENGQPFDTEKTYPTDPFTNLVTIWHASCIGGQLNYVTVRLRYRTIHV